MTIKPSWWNGVYLLNGDWLTGIWGGGHLHTRGWAGPEADQWKSSEFLHELRISGFPRFWVSPTCLRAKLLWIDAIALWNVCSWEQPPVDSNSFCQNSLCTWWDALVGQKSNNTLNTRVQIKILLENDILTLQSSSMFSNETKKDDTLYLLAPVLIPMRVVMFGFCLRLPRIWRNTTKRSVHEWLHRLPSFFFFSWDACGATGDGILGTIYCLLLLSFLSLNCNAKLQRGNNNNNNNNNINNNNNTVMSIMQ